MQSEPADLEVVGVEEAFSTILRRIPPAGVVESHLSSALDHVLAEDVYAEQGVPPHNYSAMDGYAVRATDITQAVELVVIGQSQAGHPPTHPLRAGTAILITAGAILPKGADTVVPVEKTSDTTDPDQRTTAAASGSRRRIRIHEPIPKGGNIRLAGEDIAAGSLVLTRGQGLGPSELGVLAALGRSIVHVIRRPRVAVLVTGDELIEPGSTRQPWQVYNSNGYTIGGLVVRTGGDLRFNEILSDSLPRLIQRLTQISDEVDLVVTVGGASKGHYDTVRQLALSHGIVDPLAVQVKPRKHLVLGWLTHDVIPPKELVPVVGLPGNPVAAMAGFELLVRPTLLAMRGLEEPYSADRISGSRARLACPEGGYLALTSEIDTAA